MKKSKLDSYYYKAKTEGYYARSIYKLEDIDNKYKLINNNFKLVLDLGAAPGSWLQYLDKKLKNATIVANDINDIKYSSSNIHFIKKSVFELDSSSILKFTNSKIDILLSDMAAKTTGIKIQDQSNSLELAYKALDLATELLKTNGNFICKFFNIISPDVKSFTDRVKKKFNKTYVNKPKSSTASSYENFIIGVNFKS